ncbi:hypothetical protein ABLN73_06435, partial [Mycobacterium tuberculosis]
MSEARRCSEEERRRLARRYNHSRVGWWSGARKRGAFHDKCEKMTLSDFYWVKTPKFFQIERSTSV